MTKRQTFYIRADLFETKVSPRAKLILAYLSRVSNREGKSVPSVHTIAQKCGCCPNSARKALRELERAGCIAITARDLPTRRGNRVHMANIYTLLFLPSRNEGASLHDLKGGTARAAGLRYDRENIIDVPYDHSPSVYDRTDLDPDRKRQRTVAMSFRGRDIVQLSHFFTTLLRLVHGHVAVCPHLPGRMDPYKGGAP